MTLSEWLAQLAAGVVGGIIALAGQAVIRHWRQADERRSRAEQRSESAAEEVISVLDEAHDRFVLLGDLDQVYPLRLRHSPNHSPKP